MYKDSDNLNTKIEDLSSCKETTAQSLQVKLIDEELENKKIKQFFNNLKNLYSSNQIELIFKDESLKENLIKYYILSDLYSSEKKQNIELNHYFNSIIDASILENNQNNKYDLKTNSNEDLKMILDLKSRLEKKNVMNKIMFVPQNKFRNVPKIIEFNKSMLMAIINCTPDSIANAFLSDIQNDNEKFCDKTFIDQMQNTTKPETDNYDKIINMLKKHKHSIDIIDIGGESTRPNSDVIEDQIEFERVEKLITKIRQETELKDLVISVDTRKVIKIIKLFLLIKLNYLNKKNLLELRCRKMFRDRSRYNK